MASIKPASSPNCSQGHCGDINSSRINAGEHRIVSPF
jgi:hypothetical protein